MESIDTNGTFGEDNLPIWAERFHFTHHSPSSVNRPTCLEIFEKCIARPNKIYSPPGCPLIAGTAAHQYVEQVIVDGADPGEAMRHAHSKLDEHNPQAHYPEDATKFDIIRNGQYESDVSEAESGVFDLTLEHLALGAREAVAGENKVDGGQWVSVEMPGLQLPFIGQLDLQTRAVIELKTQWPYVDSTGKAKRGFKINSLPAKPKRDHVGQVALYWKWLREQSENVPVKLVYANCKSFRVFSSEDCEELTEPRLNEALEFMRSVARAREKMMSRSDTIQELLEVIVPDFGHWMWRDKTPEFKQLAEQSWQQ
jgi:hypothetical protein